MTDLPSTPLLDALKAEARSIDALMAGGAVSYISTLDDLVATFHPTWGDDGEFEFRHNGVRVSENRAWELTL